MEVATRQSANATAKVSAKVAQTAAESTLKPDTSAQGSDSKDFSDLSLKEMEEQLGFNQ
jgi:hypothetical protein